MKEARLFRRLMISGAVLLVAVSVCAGDTGLREQALRLFRPLSIDAGPPDRLAAARVQLGKMLFFEPRASADGTVSCARCHQPALYGTDALPRSVGAGYRVHPRHSQTVLNASLQFVQHWRGDRTTVEDQAVKALIGPPSFGNPSYESAMAKLKAIPGYAAAFALAFPAQPDAMTAENWGIAIGAYVRTLVTPAPFDAFLAGDDRALSTPAQDGLRTFMQVGCAACHDGVGVGGGMYRKFGITEDYWKATRSTTIDKGRFDVTQDTADLHVFKVSSLRNVAKTPPYFHDGSVPTLPEAVRIMGRLQLGRILTETEVTNIVAFLESLTGQPPSDFVATPILPDASAVAPSTR
jgi:cytochrome c peroxidase